VLKSSKTAQKLKNEIDEESESDMEVDKNVSNNLNMSEFEENDLSNIKMILKKPSNVNVKFKPSFKTIGFKILMGKKSINQFDELTKNVIHDLEKNLMTEYFEMDDKVYDNGFNRLFSKYVIKLIYFYFFFFFMARSL